MDTHHEFTISSQQGGAVLGMIIMLLMLATLMMHVMQRQLDASLSLVVDEQQHVRDYHQAQSALEWGVHQTWPQATGWLCQNKADSGWRSCLLRLTEIEGVLLGEPWEPALLPEESNALRLWRWVQINGHSLSSLNAGWIDFCPLASAQHCAGNES